MEHPRIKVTWECCGIRQEFHGFMSRDESDSVFSEVMRFIEHAWKDSFTAYEAQEPKQVEQKNG